MLREAVKLFKEFEKKHLKTDLNGYFISFGDNLYLMPVFLPIDGVKVKRAGLHLG
ncbi:MAG: RsmF rRNA methyltransferase first C-terminal domain-containing protein, partial [Lachnospira sp.]|nr:RsmF rRNA methyltransferase first C-terminal domain-containing protein [Lachnospira sp.]